MSKTNTEALEKGLAFTPRFAADGTIPAVATDVETGDVVMLAYMNEASLRQTIETGIATYWSRSRQSLWVKGETSGNRQHIVAMRTDCDQDALWITVRVEGHGASCHRGYHSCFYRAVPTEIVGAGTVGENVPLEFCEAEPVFNPSTVYGKKS